MGDGLRLSLRWTSAAQFPITELLARVREGDSVALGQVYSAIYEELRRLARARRRKNFSFGETMNTTALVHETYLKLCNAASVVHGS